MAIAVLLMYNLNAFAPQSQCFYCATIFFLTSRRITDDSKKVGNFGTISR